MFDHQITHRGGEWWLFAIISVQVRASWAGLSARVVRRAFREVVDSPPGVRYSPVSAFSPAPRPGGRVTTWDHKSLTTARKQMNNERPDWNFWCFVTSLLDLYIQLVTLQ
ncbi:hypothetical protein GCM10010308_65150 [Streptomyces vinaceusdrappus]|nr:hypothetical protein GCM10010308_65150 [Streptomyces vinaceusdrappus]